MSAASTVSALLPSARRRRERLRGAATIALVFYACSLVVYVTSGFLRGGYDVSDIYEVGVPMMVVDCLIAFQLVFLLERVAHVRPAIRWPLIFLGVLAVTILQSLWDTQLRIWAGSIAKDYGTTQFALVRAGTLNFYHNGLFVALVGFHFANLSLREKQRQLSAARASERDAHMLALRFQLNPHFLFNTLNAISSLVVVGRAAEAEEMIDRLASFLRTSLTANPAGLVTVDEEFEMLESYLDIEAVRFGERLQTSVTLPPRLSGALIPAFLLQPLVENAIKYAVAPSSRPVHVGISAESDGDELVLVVEDDGDGCGEVRSGTGVGLPNVRERLRLRYGRLARLEKVQDGTGCRVEIRMPLEYGEGEAPAPEQALAFA